MCTLIALHRCLPGIPLVIAANRDEYLDRPSEGPALRATRTGRAVTPRDLREGGTWLGLSDRGVFAALTNRRHSDPDPARRSRGHVVMEALEAPDAETAARSIEAIPAGRHNPFNAFVADADGAWVIAYGDAPKRRALAPGAHVIGNVDPDADDAPKVARVLERARDAARRPLPDALAALRALCAVHEPGEPSLDDTCIHLGGYGTRSSTLLVVGDDPAASRLWFADGAPCRHAYRDFTPLLRELSRTARYDGGGIETRKAS